MQGATVSPIDLEVNRIIQSPYSYRISHLLRNHGLFEKLTDEIVDCLYRNDIHRLASPPKSRSQNEIPPFVVEPDHTTLPVSVSIIWRLREIAFAAADPERTSPYSFRVPVTTASALMALPNLTTSSGEGVAGSEALFL